MLQRLALNFLLALLRSGALDIVLKPLLEGVLKQSEKGLEPLLKAVEVVDDLVLDNLEKMAPETAKRFQEVLLRLFAKVRERVEK